MAGVSPSTCAMRCQRRRSSASPVRRLKAGTRTRRPCSANDSAVKQLGDPVLKKIAQELVAHVRRSVTIDWTLREAAQAQIRVIVRRILRKYGYPPDKQEKATQTVLEQAKLICAEVADMNAPA